MNAEEIIEIAKINLMKDFPFLTPLLMSIDVEINNGRLAYVGKDGDKIKMVIGRKVLDWILEDEDIYRLYNRSGEVAVYYYIILHELFHIVNKHIIVKKSDKLMNLCADMIIEKMINEKYGILRLRRLIEYVERKYNINVLDYSFEELYELLKNDDEFKNVEYEEYEEIDLKDEDMEEVEKKVIEGILNEERLKGLDSLGKKLKTKLLKPKLNWKKILMNYIRDLSYRIKDYSYEKLHKKSYSLDIALPGEVKENVLKVNIIVDTSGSVIDEVDKFISEVKNLIDGVNVEGKVYVHDAELLYENDLNRIKNNFNELMKNVMGGGGTSHREIIQKIRKDRGYVINIFFTDGYSDLEKYENDLRKFRNIFIVPKDYNQYLNKIGKVIIMEK